MHGVCLSWLLLGLVQTGLAKAQQLSCYCYSALSQQAASTRSERRAGELLALQSLLVGVLHVVSIAKSPELA